MSAAPKCSTCIFMEVQGRAKMTANGFVEKGTRGDCVCSHPKALEAFRRVCPQSPRAPGFIGYTDPGGDVPRIKTSPRWCPLKAEADVQAALLGDHEAAKRLTERYELLPCPCCGGQAKCFGGPSIAYVRCKACGLEICRMDADGEDIISQICAVAPKYEARLAWNTRAPIMSAEGAEEMEMIDNG